MKNHYQTEQQIAEVLFGFEQCTTGKSEFTHLSHLTVGVCYLRNSTPDQAIEKMRAGLFRFIEHHDIPRSKYSEQVTRDWLALIHGVLEELDPKLSLLATTNIVLAHLGKSRTAKHDEK